MSASVSFAVTITIGVGPIVPDLAADVGAGHAREHQVEQDDVRTPRADVVDGAEAVVQDGALVAFALEAVADGVGERRLVLDDQHAAHAALPSWARGVAGSVTVNVDPDAELALDVDLAAVVLDDVPDDGEAEPGAAGRARASLVDAVEALEDPRHLVGRDADALVGDGDRDRGRRCASAASSTLPPSE